MTETPDPADNLFSPPTAPKAGVDPNPPGSTTLPFGAETNPGTRFNSKIINIAVNGAPPPSEPHEDPSVVADRLRGQAQQGLNTVTQPLVYKKWAEENQGEAQVYAAQSQVQKFEKILKDNPDIGWTSAGPDPSKGYEAAQATLAGITAPSASTPNRPVPTVKGPIPE